MSTFYFTKHNFHTATCTLKHPKSTANCSTPLPKKTLRTRHRHSPNTDSISKPPTEQHRSANNKWKDPDSQIPRNPPPKRITAVSLHSRRSSSSWPTQAGVPPNNTKINVSTMSTEKEPRSLAPPDNERATLPTWHIGTGTTPAGLRARVRRGQTGRGGGGRRIECRVHAHAPPLPPGTVLDATSLRGATAQRGLCKAIITRFSARSIGLADIYATGDYYYGRARTSKCCHASFYGKGIFHGNGRARADGERARGPTSPDHCPPWKSVPGARDYIDQVKQIERGYDETAPRRFKTPLGAVHLRFAIDHGDPVGEHLRLFGKMAIFPPFSYCRLIDGKYDAWPNGVLLRGRHKGN